MKCEVKYIRHDVIKALKTSSFSTILVCTVIGTTIGLVTYYFFGHIGIWIIALTAWILIPIIGWKEAVQYCNNKGR